ncbi:uncharacterized protein BJ171DRAFT_518578 [Polychytrium aggregatum]|uniref:uncharacterized protein n=1 Tax=Polychytrium aggregatum TaxID=110093 RepID=UPI0022FE27DE|nr:uncharacterized protein BJ171DRAFT_518578 [Polychytrium aggregatum]KAI9199508.1 hypothetical protein BJ171DRAFT_518578 [Polychytrium aggregatum]
MSVTRVSESRVFSTPVQSVWARVRPTTFDWWSNVVKAEVEGHADQVGSVRKVTFKDGTVQKLKILELSDLDNFVTYEVIESNPPIDVLAAIHTIRLRKVTFDNSTFVEWTSDFSSGSNTSAVVEDSRFKKREAFADLSTALAKH